MSGLLKEEILTTIKKKRFIILMPVLYILVIVAGVMLKNGHFNDLTFLFRMQKFVNMVFTPASGVLLLFTVHRRKYTKNSIIQAEDHGAKRSTAVLARALAGSIILIALHALIFLFIIVLGLILGAGNTGAQIGQFAVLVLMNALAAAVTYVGVLFWEYLFAFPLVSMLVYLAATLVAPYVYSAIDHYANSYYKYCTYAFPKLLTDVIYTRFAFHNPPVLAFFILLAQAVVPLLLTMLVFKFKKKERKKRKKKGEIEEAVEEIKEAADAVEEAVMNDPEVKEIMKESEQVEDLPL